MMYCVDRTIEFESLWGILCSLVLWAGRTTSKGWNIHFSEECFWSQWHEMVRNLPRLCSVLSLATLSRDSILCCCACVLLLHFSLMSKGFVP